MQIYAAMRAMHLKQETSPNIMTESVGSRWYLQAAKVRQKCDKWFAGWQNTPWVACWFISKYVQICRSTGWVAHGATLETTGLSAGQLQCNSALTQAGELGPLSTGVVTGHGTVCKPKITTLSFFDIHHFAGKKPDVEGIQLTKLSKSYTNNIKGIPGDMVINLCTVHAFC